MKIENEELNIRHIGRYVKWRDGTVGRIKGFTEDHVFVVFNADGNLDTPRFTEYTGQGCHPDDLSFVRW